MFETANNRVVASLGNLPVGGDATVTIVVRPTTTAIGTTLSNTVAVTATETDPNPTNNVNQVVTTAVIAAMPPPVDTAGPTVVRLQRFGFHARPTRLVLTFNEALNPARAIDRANYRLTGPHGAVIRIRSATYDPTSRSVTLRPVHLLNLHHIFRLVVRGTSAGGLADPIGNALDGDGDGRPGGDFTGRIDRDSLAGVPGGLARTRLMSRWRDLNSHGTGSTRSLGHGA
jgi:type VI secretion system secreted protein VgrG